MYSYFSDFSQLYSQANDQALKQEEEVCEKLNLLSDILTAHQLLCERYDKGVAVDHQRAMEKMTAYKNAKLQKSFSRNEVKYLIIFFCLKLFLTVDIKIFNFSARH